MYVDYQGHFKLITCIIKLVSLKGSGFIFEIISRTLQTDMMQHKTSQNLKGPKMIFWKKIHNSRPHWIIWSQCAVQKAINPFFVLYIVTEVTPRWQKGALVAKALCLVVAQQKSIAKNFFFVLSYANLLER